MVTYEELCGPFEAPGPWLVDPCERDIVEVSGPEAAEFLHRLCSQDVAGMADGELRPGTFLSAKGKLVALVQIARLGESLLIETQSERFDELAELIDRYHFTENLEITPRRDWLAAEILGVDGRTICGQESASAQLTDDGLLHLAGSRRGLSWLRVHGPAPAVAVWAAAAEPSAMPSGLREALRIASGEVRVGLDSTERTLALEAEIDDHFHLDKGCYTGQEIVARVHTYGHLNRRLKLLKLATTAPVEPGTEVVEAGEEDVVVRVLSTAIVPGKDFTLGLGYVPEVFLEDPEPLVLAGADGAMVEILDFAASPDR